MLAYQCLVGRLLVGLVGILRCRNGKGGAPGGASPGAHLFLARRRAAAASRVRVYPSRVSVMEKMVVTVVSPSLGSKDEGGNRRQRDRPSGDQEQGVDRAACARRGEGADSAGVARVAVVHGRFSDSVAAGLPRFV